MAGSISLAGMQQFDVTGGLLAGAEIQWIQAGTTSTPQDAFYDPDLTLPLPNPYTLEADARVPFHYLADGQIKVRITDKDGVIRFQQDNILVVGPSSGGGGGGGGVDPTTVAATGDVKARYGTGTLSGFVRLNGRTIGSATSGATERANSDTQALFQFLWGADANLAVSGGRGVSAAADWSADKTLTLPDARGRALAALDDMGNSAAGRLTSSYFGATATTLGASGGGESNTLVTANLPPYTPAGTLSVTATTPNLPWRSTSLAIGGGDPAHPGVEVLGSTAIPITASGTFAGTAQGGTSTPLRTVQPTILVTFYIKL